MAFLQAHQLSVMLFMSGVSGILAFATLLMDTLPRGRKSVLTLMELSAMLLLIFDRFAYIYRGVPGTLGSVMVWVSNGTVYFLSLFIPYLVTYYLRDVLLTEGKLKAAPRRLLLCDALFAVGTALIVVSQFTGLYYTIDEHNVYHRAPGNVICFLIPILLVLTQEAAILRYRSSLGRNLVTMLQVSIALPTAASIVQLFHYGVSLTNLTMVLMVVVFYVYALHDLGKTVRRARRQQLETQKRENDLLVQTVKTLANAVDAKDAYTSGHSTRVARYSKRIAQEAGMTERECEQAYFAGLLHDVGKIGVHDDIINKPDSLTEAEFEQIKLHPILGDSILSGIAQAPYLREGARFHHERYDGTGYPDGLAGETIPKYARIIAVADAFDAMTSRRSYRNPIPRWKVRQELFNGMGTQFDPKYAKIMLQLLDSGECDD